ncbi:MAG: hypothetical protein MUF64_29275 [Polyangiaceae bacterium]|nr:hypothetical protein [Polyangiaceae bacterium]
MAAPSLQQQAADPATPASELRKLAASATLAPQVASNPNAPLDCLLELLPRYPDLVLQNATMLLALLERPGLIERLPFGARAAMAQSPHVTPEVAWKLLDSAREDRTYQIHQRLAENPHVPRELLERLLFTTDPQTRAEAWKNPALPDRWPALLRSCGADPTLFEPPEGASGEPSVLEQIAAQGGWGAQFAASHPRTPIALLEELARQDEYSVNLALARNPALPEPLLRRLFKRNQALLALAQHPALPPDLLRSLAAHLSPVIRGHVARNPRVETAVLLALLGDIDPDVRVQALQSGRVPAAWLARLQRLGVGLEMQAPVPIPLERLEPGDIEALIEGPPWFQRLAALVDPLPAQALLRLASCLTVSPMLLIHRDPLPAGLLDALLDRHGSKEQPWYAKLLELKAAAPLTATSPQTEGVDLCRLQRGQLQEIRLTSQELSLDGVQLQRWKVQPGNWVEQDEITAIARVFTNDTDPHAVLQDLMQKPRMLTSPVSGIVVEQLPMQSEVQVGQVYLRVRTMPPPGT